MRQQARLYLSSIEFSKPCSYDVTLFEELLDKDAKHLNAQLLRIFYTYVDGLTRNPGKTKPEYLIHFLEAIPPEHRRMSDRLNFFADYLADLTEFTSEIGDLRKESVNSIAENSQVYVALKKMEHKDTRSSQILSGYVHSLRNREKAAACFASGSHGIQDLIEAFGIDTGANTYFAEIDAEVATERLRSLQFSEAQEQKEPSTANGVLVSMDERFFRIYAPQLLLYAHHLRDLHFHFVIAGNAGEMAIEIEKKFSSLLQSITRMESAKNVSFYSLPVPEWAASARTFYACARFFAAPHILKMHDRVYVTDADACITGNLSTLIDSIVGDICLPKSKGFTALSPWKRHIANSLFLRSNDAVGKFLETLNRYLAYGLSTHNSWMLDQNGLTYALERHADLIEHTDLNDYKRVVERPAIFSKFEANVR